MSVQADTGPGSGMYRPVSFQCLSKLDHSYLTFLLVRRGVYLSCPLFFPNTPRELWSLRNTSFILFSRELKDKALNKMTQMSQATDSSWLPQVGSSLGVSGQDGTDTLLIRRHEEFCSRVCTQTPENHDQRCRALENTSWKGKYTR